MEYGAVQKDLEENGWFSDAKKADILNKAHILKTIREMKAAQKAPQSKTENKNTVISPVLLKNKRTR